MNLKESISDLVSLDLENEVLGVVLMNPKLIKTYYLKEEVFYDPTNRYIYYIMKRLDEKGYEIDSRVILEEATQINEHDNGLVYTKIKELVQTSMSQSSMDYKQDRLQELYMKRAQVEMAYKIIENASSTTYEKLSTSIDRSLKKIEQSMPSKKNTHISEYFNQAIIDMETEKGEFEGSPTHLKDLDKMCGGMKKGELVIIGANPSVGKTVMATNIAQNHSVKNNGITAIFSLEMSGLSLAQRMISSMSNVPGFKVKSAAKEYKDKDWEATMQTIGIMGNTKTEIIEETGLTISDIRRMSYSIKEKYKDSDEHMIIMVDYLGLIRKEDNRQQTREHMKDVAVGLKNLAKELNATVIALSQLSRDNEKDKRKPIMADLKESGDIEAAADWIMLLYREDYQGRETEKKDIIEIITAKNRNGGVGSVEMKFMKAFSKFINIG